MVLSPLLQVKQHALPLPQTSTGSICSEYFLVKNPDSLNHNLSPRQRWRCLETFAVFDYSRNS